MNRIFTLNLFLALSPLSVHAALITPLAETRTLDGRIVVQDFSVPTFVTDTHQDIRKDAAAWADLQSLSASTLSTTVASGTFSITTPKLNGPNLTSVAASGDGSGSFVATAANAYAEITLLSSFTVKFEVDEPVQFRLSGVVAEQQEINASDIDAWSLVALRKVELRHDGTTVVLNTLYSSTPNQTFDVTGTLLPGTTYEVLGLSEITMQKDAILSISKASASWSFGLGITPVPEPAAYGLAVAVLLGGFAGFRRFRFLLLRSRD
jgi:hypothetical protein